MKKIIAVLCTVAMIISLSACIRFFPEDKPAGTTADTQQTTVQSPSVTVNSDIQQTTATCETTVQTESEWVLPNPEGSVVVGKSSNGYDIALKDGITYVGGILIANKSYELPQSYNPGGLTQECSDAFNSMAAAAAAEGINLYVLSGFRSYETQDGLYTKYCNSDGKDAADRYSARPGHSEHQTGLAIDVNSVSHTFADTAEGVWLAEHCTDYGFILRYPDGKESKTGYMYEPWHIRYIGSVDIAKKITVSGLCLEEYLGIGSAYAQ